MQLSKYFMNSPDKKRKSIDGFIPAGSSGLNRISSDSRPHRRLDDFHAREDGLRPSSIVSSDVEIPKKDDRNNPVFGEKVSPCGIKNASGHEQDKGCERHRIE